MMIFSVRAMRPPNQMRGRAGWFGFVLLLAWFTALSPAQEPDLTENLDRAAHIDQSCALLWLSLMHRSPSDSLIALCDRSLTQLMATIERDGLSRVNRTGSNTLDLKANRRTLFQQQPILPPEEVADGRWSFAVVRLDLVPRHLFVHAVTFKASRTIRLRWVRLIFADGSMVEHKRWADLENGNGRAFRKHTYLPWLKTQHDQKSLLAKRLRAIEILGSAQDSHFSAQLDFMLRVPDPNQKPQLSGFETVRNLRRTLRARDYDRNTRWQALVDLAAMR